MARVPASRLLQEQSGHHRSRRPKTRRMTQPILWSLLALVRLDRVSRQTSSKVSEGYFSVVEVGVSPIISYSQTSSLPRADSGSRRIW